MDALCAAFIGPRRFTFVEPASCFVCESLAHHQRCSIHTACVPRQNASAKRSRADSRSPTLSAVDACCAGVLVFILPGSIGQSVYACIFAYFSILVYLRYSPHLEPLDGTLYTLGATIL
jgi:hypothetical protein